MERILHLVRFALDIEAHALEIQLQWDKLISKAPLEVFAFFPFVIITNSAVELLHGRPCARFSPFLFVGDPLDALHEIQSQVGLFLYFEFFPNGYQIVPCTCPFELFFIRYFFGADSTFHRGD